MSQSDPPTDGPGAVPPGMEWAADPVEIAIPPLRWSILHGTDLAGNVRWVLRERLDDDDDVLLVLAVVREVISSTELANRITPIAGRPVADTLVSEVFVRLPNALIDARLQPRHRDA